MKKYIITGFLIWATVFAFGQADSLPGNDLEVSVPHSDPEITSGSYDVSGHDENVFLCNWHLHQTFVYWEDKIDINVPRKLCLLQPGEEFCLPVYGKLWSVFKKSHNGLDVNLKTGDTIRSVFDGRVRYAEYNKGGFGNLVIVRHKNGLETYYAHFSKLMVKPGQDVKAGEVIGLGGSTGRSKGPHLHFEVRFHDVPLEPFSFIDFTNKKLKTTELDLDATVFEPWNHGIVQASVDSINTLVSGNVYVSKPVTHTGTIGTGQGNTHSGSGTSYYTVRRGDSLYKIANKYHTTVNKLCQLNKMKSSDHLAVGRKLRVK